MKVIYIHSSFKSCGPTNQFLTLLSTNINRVDKFYFVLKHPFLPSRSCKKNNAVFLNIFTFLEFICTREQIVIHSSGFCPDLLSFLISFLFPRHLFVSTIRNVPWIDYDLYFPFVVSNILCLFHLFVFNSNRLSLVACSQSLLTSIESRIPACHHFIDNCYTGSLALSASSFYSNSSPLRLLSLSPILRRKRVQQLINAFLSLDLPNILTVCGDGPLLASISSSINDHRIRVRGHVSVDPIFFSDFDVLISFSSSEGLPNSVIEALYNGLICILSPIPSHIYLASITSNVIILKDISASSLKDAIDYSKVLHSSNDELNKIHAYFNPIRMNQQYVDFYFKQLS